MTSEDQFAHMARVNRLYKENPALQSGEASLVKQPTAGTKLDDGKVRLELIPGELIFAVGDILTFGAKKYAARNWEKGIHWGRVFGATMRHLWSWWQGKAPTTKNFLFGNLDAETGKSHLWHAATCLSFLIAYEEREMTAFDDRPEVHLPLAYKTPADYKRHSNPEGSHQEVSSGMMTGEAGGYGTPLVCAKGYEWSDAAGRCVPMGPTWHNETPQTVKRHSAAYWEHLTERHKADRFDPEGGIPGRA